MGAEQSALRRVDGEEVYVRGNGEPLGEDIMGIDQVGEKVDGMS